MTLILHSLAECSQHFFADFHVSCENKISVLFEISGSFSRKHIA